MRLVVTGGGTGGHVYPALEVARLAAQSGAAVRYFGGDRGQEASACREAGIAFAAFGSAPMRRPWTPGGLRAAWLILRGAASARKELASWRPHVLFSTGGYAASPVLAAAKSLRLPIVLHEQNAVPGRTNRIMQRFAARVCVVFDEAAHWFGRKAVRTGMPIRELLCRAAKRAHEGRGPSDDRRDGTFTLSYGGSQGSAAINEAVLTVAMRLGREGDRWLQITGPRLFETAARASERVCLPPGYAIKAFLDAGEIAEVYSDADLAITRAGAGTVSELAIFGIPAIYIPYPFAHGDHQLHNAKAVEKIGGGTVLAQRELTPERLEREWRNWTADCDRRRRAAQALRAWSVPDATQQVFDIVKETANAAAVGS